MFFFSAKYCSAIILSSCDALSHVCLCEQVQQLETQSRRSITRSQPYFAEKEASERALSDQKQLVERLQVEVARAKQEYAAALRRLECISDEIHCRRAKGPREPGVGAELIAEPEPEMGPCVAAPNPASEELTSKVCCLQSSSG